MGLPSQVSRNPLYVAPMLHLTSFIGLPEGVFELPLKSLYIGYCKKLPLDVIDTICQKLPQLESLDLSGLEMTALPPSIGDCKSLTSLDLSYCRSLAVDKQK